MSILLIVLIIVSVIQTGTIVACHIQTRKIEEQRTEAIHTVALSIESTKVDPKDLDSIKKHIYILLCALEHHEHVNDAAKEKTKADFKKLVDDAIKGCVKYSD